MLELTVRLVASLAVVVGLLLVLARFAGRRFSGRAGAPIQVMHRQSLSRTSSVAMISVGSRVLLVGSTDHQVSLLAEVDPVDLELPEPALDEEDYFDPYGDLPGLEPADEPAVTALPTRLTVRPRTLPLSGPASASPLAGSLLSADTWRAALSAATGKRS